MTQVEDKIEREARLETSVLEWQQSLAALQHERDAEVFFPFFLHS